MPFAATTLVAIAFLRAQSPITFENALVGSYVGTLEYRDYSDDSRERLPTLLRVYRPKNGAGLVFRYVFDDGPSKVVQEQTSVVIDAKKKTYIVVSDGDKHPYTVSGLDSYKLDGTGTVTLIGSGTENDKAVEIRETIWLNATSFRLLRESRLPGGQFQFRHVYDLTRVVQPGKS